MAKAEQDNFGGAARSGRLIVLLLFLGLLSTLVKLLQVVVGASETAIFEDFFGAAAPLQSMDDILSPAKEKKIKS